MAVLGIDLGTANSAAAILLTGNPTPKMIVPDESAPGGSSDAIYPSYVYFQDGGTAVSIGTSARDKFFNQGQSNQVARHFKRLIGRSFDEVIGRIAQGHRGFLEYEGRIEKDTDGLIKLKVGEISLPIRVIAAQLIKGMVDDARKQYPGEEITAVTVCLPARFDDAQRQETEKAAKLAGITNALITVLEEPTAALIAKGLAGTKGTVLVIDVGAGTTDVILGNMQPTINGLRLFALQRAGDDLLGGIDMDNLILDYLINDDLKNLYPQLDDDSQLKLVGKIEETKISVSLNGGNGSISRRFRLKDNTSTLYNHTFTLEKLDEIVSPVVQGYTTSLGYQKGIKPTVERVLLAAANGQTQGLAQVVKSIEHVVLVGGPCRMKVVHNMLKEVLKDNPGLIAQLDSLNPLDSFFMEGVATGAATSTNGHTSIATAMSSTFGVYTNQRGFISVFPKNSSYKREIGLKGTVEIDTDEGANQFFTIDRHDECSPREWKIASHLINVPQKGKLSINIIWAENGAGITVSGCNLPEQIALPSHMEDFGDLISGIMKTRYEMIRDIDQHRKTFAPMLKAMLHLTLNEDEAGIAAQKHLYLSPMAIEECSALDVNNSETQISETEFKRIVDEGFFKVSDEIIANKSPAYREADNLVGKIIPLIQQIRTPSTVNDLLLHAKRIISTGQENNSVFGQQLMRHFTLLEAKPNDATYAAATATSMVAYAEYLFHNSKLSQEDYDKTLAICWRFSNPSG